METSCSKLRRKIQTKFALEGKKFEPKALQKYFRSKIFHFLFICSWIFFLYKAVSRWSQIRPYQKIIPSWYRSSASVRLSIKIVIDWQKIWSVFRLVWFSPNFFLPRLLNLRRSQPSLLSAGVVKGEGVKKYIQDIYKNLVKSFGYLTDLELRCPNVFF